MNQTENRQLDEILARAIYSSGSPLSLVEHEDWITFMEKLRPSYELPSRSALSNRLLENEYQREALVQTKLAEVSVLALQIDAWSNWRNESVVNFVVTTPEPFFFKTLGTKTERHTAEYMATKMEDVMTEIGIEKFGAVVTDDASVMVKATSILEEKYSHIAVYTCAAHTLQLIIADVTKLKSVKDIVDTCKTIVKEINKSQILRANFTELQKKNVSDLYSKDSGAH